MGGGRGGVGNRGGGDGDGRSDEAVVGFLVVLCYRVAEVLTWVVMGLRM